MNGFGARVHRIPGEILINLIVVLIGYSLGGETLGLRTILGTLLVLISVVVITTTRAKKPVTSLPVEDTAEVVGS